MGVSTGSGMYALSFEELLLWPGTAEPLGTMGVPTGGAGVVVGVGVTGVEVVLVIVAVCVTVWVRVSVRVWVDIMRELGTPPVGVYTGAVPVPTGADDSPADLVG